MSATIIDPTLARSVRDTCLCLNIQRAARSVMRRYDEAFRPLEITSGQFSLLMLLVRPEPPAIGRLAADLAMDRTTLTANLKPLVREGLVTIDRHEHDRRSRVVEITARGRARLAEAMPLWRAAQTATKSKAGPIDFANLRSDLATLSAEH